MLLKRKEKEFHETLDHLQLDMDTLEKEKADLKERLMHSSKKVLLEGLTKSAASLSPISLLSSPQSFTSSSAGTTVPLALFNATEITWPISSFFFLGGGRPVGSGVTTQVRDSPLLVNEVSHLRQALRQSQAENAQLVAQKLRSKLDTLPPLAKPKSNPPSASTKGPDALKELTKKAHDLKWVHPTTIQSFTVISIFQTLI